MKAIVCTQYGAPDVLQYQDVQNPTPKDSDVLIKVRAVSVTPSDCAFRKGDPFIVRLIYGLRKPRIGIFGVEFAGEIEAVGKHVTSFKPGDQVFGMSPKTFGAYAESMCLAEEAPMVIKPAKASFEDMVGVCDGAATAMTFLRDVAKVQRGQKVLINGASGAVGAYAVQIAKYFGAEVTGVCSGANAAMVKALGADHVIDYTKTDFTQSGQTYDVIFDAVGKSTFSHCKKALTATGLYMTTVPGLGILFQMLRTKLLGGKRAGFTTAGLLQSKATLTVLKELFEAGAIRAVIDRCYTLEQAAEAHRYVETGRKKGNVVISLT